MKLTLLGFAFCALWLSPLIAAQEPPDESLEDLLSTRVVTASRYDQDMSEAPASVYIVTAEEIDRFGYTTLADVIASVPGFFTTYDRNYTYIGVRGFSRPTDYNNRILILLDGHSTNENFYGSTYAGTELALNLDAVERVEVVKGPGSSLYGTGAMFAVVNVISKPGKAEDGLTVSGTGGSFGKAVMSASYGRALRNGVDVKVSGLYGDIQGRNLYFREYDQLATNNGVAEGLDWDKFYGVQSRASYRGLKFISQYSWRKKGVPTGAWDVLFGDDSTYTLDERLFFELSQETAIRGNSSLRLTASYDLYRYSGAYPYLEAVLCDRNMSDWINFGGQFLWDVTPGNRIIAGAGYTDNLETHMRVWDHDTVWFEGDYPSTVASAYVQNEYQMLSNLAFTGGVRWDDYSYIKNGSALAPRFGLVYNPFKRSTIKLVFSQAFRVPSPYEMYYEDAVGGYKPNLQLRPERISTSELIVEQKLNEHFRCFLSAYYNYIKGLIDYVVDPVDSMLQYDNRGEARAYGTEIGVRATVAGGGLVQSSLGYQHSFDPATNERLTNSPQWIARAGLSWPVSPVGSAAVNVRYESPRLTVYGTETEGFVLTDLNFILEPRLWGPADGSHRLRAVVGVNNVFNTDYSLPGGYEHRQDRIEQDGRSVSLKLQYRL